MESVVGEEDEEAAGQSEGVADPEGPDAWGEHERRGGSGQGKRFGRGGESGGSPSRAERGFEDATQREALRQLMDDDRQRQDPAGERRVEAGRGQRPTVEGGVDGGGDQERDGEPVEGRGAVVVIMIVGADGADGNTGAIENREEPKTHGKKENAEEPG